VVTWKTGWDVMRSYPGIEGVVSRRLERDGRADAAPKSWRVSSIDNLMFHCAVPG